MKKPNHIIFKLYDIGLIHGISIDLVQSGIDSSETRCVITGSNGTCKGLWSTYLDYLIVDADFRSIARLYPEHVKEVVEYSVFERANTEELAEYERLKNKFDNK